MMPFGGHTVDVVDPPVRDRHGDPVPGSPAEVQVSGCYMQPASSTETLDGQEQVSRLWELILPPGVAVTALHRVRFRGEMYEVDGDPQPWDDATGAGHHLEVRLRRVTG